MSIKEFKSRKEATFFYLMENECAGPDYRYIVACCRSAIEKGFLSAKINIGISDKKIKTYLDIIVFFLKDHDDIEASVKENGENHYLFECNWKNSTKPCFFYFNETINYDNLI